ncbi:serine/threonine-protein phosphatase PGAM5, mitochondrial-like isoform X2 [Mya arenaria]|uniref:serine/threonine-protein phosphatase PGAM5, mitochondrial-like isoform X2 n=1 Tax=Mya arenaria TaxID=6604 RepID=UPI0022E6CC8F|nr:serine/threonine-protein phosphatase PGAM5, mitochondrial-like isoform X2 [Mya arenaria]
MKKFLDKVYRFSKVYGLTAAGAVAVIGVLVYDKARREPVYSSWTTNYDPSVKWDYNWDRREPKSLVKPLKESATDDEKQKYLEKEEKKVGTATRHIIMIRHGQYFDKEKYDADRMLTELGREQANLTGLRLAELNYPYTKLICSTMTRAQETADIIHKHLPDLPRENDDMLREGAPIPPEPPSGNWRPEASFYGDGARIEAAFRKYFHRAEPEQTKDSYEIMVCHANVIRYFVCRALQFTPEAWLRISLNHASLTWVYIRPNGRVGIRTMGEAGFMPPDKLSVM